ncbi:MAG: hypothetical protein HQ462_06370 [Deltaproteobacteria bacterium]|nr:hypothetical protein [Deltaproteobacteria bacterium]
MRKILIGTLPLFLSFWIPIIAYGGVTSEHLAKLKSKYPHGLLSDDYGVLTVKDLALNACHIKPEPFVPGAFTPYEYWICFESKNILAICEDQHFSNEDGHVGRVQVEAHDHQIAYQFIAARPWAIRDCIDFVKTLKNLVRGTSHACISASYIDKEKKNQRGQMERIGIFNRIKTDKGCEGKECVFTEKIRQEYCPDLK